MNKNQLKENILNKLYGGKRKVWMHNFRIEDGICEHCGAFLGDKGETLLCNVITPDEVRQFKNIIED